MDRSKRIREDRTGTEPGENPISSPAATAPPIALPVTILMIALTLLATGLFAMATPSVAAPALTDLWDAAVDLDRLCAGDTTLILVCDPGLATCREGAVYFDNKASLIREAEVRPTVILIGDPATIRETVLDLGIRIPVFIDQGETVFGSILAERILPALVLMDPDGRVIEIIYGGGDSLDGNIKTLIGTEPVTQAETDEEGGFNWWLLAVPLAAALAILPFVID